MKLKDNLFNFLKKNKKVYSISRYIYFRLPYVIRSKINEKKIPVILNNNIKKNYNFLYIGANDLSEINDPFINYITKYNLTGTCLEPNYEMYRLISEKYLNNSNIIFKNYGIGLKNEKSKLYYWNQKDGHKQASTNKYFVLNNKKHFDQSKELKLIEQEVELKDLDTILKDINHKVDIFIIDIESNDFYILEKINLKLFNPNIILYEEAHMTEDQKKKILNKFKKFNYKTIRSWGDVYCFKK